MTSEFTSAVSAVSAAGALLAAFAAWRSAYYSERSSRGALVAKLHDDWWEYEIKRSKIELKNWLADHKEECCYEEFGKLHRSFKSGELQGDDKEDYKNIDEARRTIKAYFIKVHHLYKQKYIKKSDVVEVLAPQNRVGVLIKTIEGFEKSKDKKYDEELFVFFSSLYGKERIHADI